MKFWMMALGLSTFCFSGVALAQQSVDESAARQDVIRQNRLNDLNSRNQSSNDATRLDQLRRQRNSDAQERQLRRSNSSQRSKPANLGGPRDNVVQTQ